MKSKRVCALLLTTAMVVGTLAGCGGGDNSGASTGTDSAPAATDSGDSAPAASDDGSSAASGEVIELTFFNADANQDDP